MFHPHERGLAHLQREYSVSGVEVRASKTDSNLIDFYGHASVTGRAYPMYGGPTEGGWNETVMPGAFRKTLRENADVAFLVNHEGMTLARTKAGTLQLAEDSVGLEVRATMDRRVSVVNDLALLMEAGNLDEMSFAFRTIRQSWTNSDGEEVPWWDTTGINRNLTELSLQKGDVSVVNYGASPFTDASLRALDKALRSGTLSKEQRDLIIIALKGDVEIEGSQVTDSSTDDSVETESEGECCGSCGADMPAGASFCPSCGAAQMGDAGNPDTQMSYQAAWLQLRRRLVA